MKANNEDFTITTAPLNASTGEVQAASDVSAFVKGTSFQPLPPERTIEAEFIRSHKFNDMGGNRLDLEAFLEAAQRVFLSKTFTKFEFVQNLRYHDGFTVEDILSLADTWLQLNIKANRVKIIPSCYDVTVYAKV